MIGPQRVVRAVDVTIAVPVTFAPRNFALAQSGIEVIGPGNVISAIDDCVAVGKVKTCSNSRLMAKIAAKAKQFDTLVVQACTFQHKGTKFASEWAREARLRPAPFCWCEKHGKWCGTTENIGVAAVSRRMEKLEHIEPHCPLGVGYLKWQRGEEACATSEMIS